MQNITFIFDRCHRSRALYKDLTLLLSHMTLMKVLSVDIPFFKSHWKMCLFDSCIWVCWVVYRPVSRVESNLIGNSKSTLTASVSNSVVRLHACQTFLQLSQEYVAHYMCHDNVMTWKPSRNNWRTSLRYCSGGVNTGDKSTPVVPFTNIG